MISERIHTRLRKDRPMTTITLRIPIDVVEALKELAPKTGHSGYQALLKAYIGEGLRRDEAKHFFGPAERLADALRRRGVPDDLLKDAMEDLAA